MTEQRSSKSQRELLNFVDNFIQTHGYGPSYREIMRGLGYKSVSTVAVHIDGLISRGYLLKRDRSARSLEIVSSNYNEAPIKKIVDASKEKWMIDAINSKFDSINDDNKKATLEEIDILIKALKILDFENAYVSMCSKLNDYEKIID